MNYAAFQAAAAEYRGRCREGTVHLGSDPRLAGEHLTHLGITLRSNLATTSGSSVELGGEVEDHCGTSSALSTIPDSQSHELSVVQITAQSRS